MDVDVINLDKFRNETDDDYRFRILGETEEWRELINDRLKWTDLEGAKKDFKQLFARIGMVARLFDPEFKRYAYRERKEENVKKVLPTVEVKPPVVIDIAALTSEVVVEE